MGQAALLFKIVVAPFPEGSKGVFGEEVWRTAPASLLPESRFRTILAELRWVIVGWLSPSAGYAGEAVRFVLPP
jgi:hypothetical protein